MSTSAKLLQEDITELDQLRQQAKRYNVQSALDEILIKWNSKLDEVKRQESQKQRQEVLTSSAPPVAQARASKKLTTYAFDESDKFVKLYYTMPGISDVAAASITTKFTESSFEVICTNVSGIDYEIKVQGLCYAVEPEKCQAKQKSGDQLLVMLKKVKENEQWGSLLKLDKKQKKEKMPKLDEDSDPQAGLMNLMKQMYEEGDDEMKKQIKKSWHEAQAKKNTMDMDF